MSRFSLMAISGAVLAAACATAQARDNCGRGWFYNGAACVQEEGWGPGYRPAPRYYQEPRYYREQYYDERLPGNGNPNGFYRGRDGQLHCYNRSFTVQDGFCKPYRGG